MTLTYWDCLVDCWETRTLEREGAVKVGRRFIVLAHDADEAFSCATQAAMDSAPFGTRLLGVKTRQAATCKLPLQVPRELP